MMLMNPNTGSVASYEEWENDFNTSTSEEWGGNYFEDAGLVEVVPNIKGEAGYDPEVGEWRQLQNYEIKFYEDRGKIYIL